MFFIHFAHRPSHSQIPPNIRRLLRKGSQTYHDISRVEAKRLRRKYTPEEIKKLEKHYDVMLALQTAMKPYRKAFALDLAMRLRKAIAFFATHEPELHRTFGLESTAERFAARLEKTPNSYHIFSMYGGIRALESLARVARERKLKPLEMRGITRLMTHLSEAIRKSEME